MERKMFDTPVLPRLETILAEVKSGDLIVPEFQRPFVWDDDRRLTLLDSIVKGMPIGSLLVWRTNRRDLHTYKKVGGVRLGGARKGDEKVNYLIDGHQRISTLFGALYSGDREPTSDDNVRWPLYYELGADNRPAFRVPPRRRSVPSNWLPLNILLDGDKLFDFTQQLRQGGKRELAKEAERLANVFRDYIIPIVPLITEELDVVTDAFVRINSQGKGMSEAHMLRALTHAGGVDTDRYFADVRARLEPLGWGGLDAQILVNVLKAQLDLDVYAAGVRGLHAKLLEDPAPLKKLASVLVETVEFLAAIGVRGPGALPYTYQLVTLATLVARFPGKLLKPKIHKRLRNWFWVTTYTEYFSGSTGSRIRDEIDGLAGELDGGSPLKREPVPVKPLTEIRMSTVRARAFLLFMAGLPEHESACQSRQEWLGTGDTRAVPSLLSSTTGVDPGNRVIANPAELRTLRKAIQENEVSPTMADEFAIPLGALRNLQDEDKFLLERRKWLREKERLFIEGFGLSVSDSE
ncbi:DUF262 domain-containing protein [Corallococcus praedator]|uniref:DUF262 domain-containing protein n=1 Tax=Corallococcus praedator TaxID=2316724 RepID=A0ABX9QQN8_9BACT|nr:MULTISPECIES: DUF262 domain-containing protein [Corallococcus]RKH36169.1 DUF262 domain-containing protein [Corallococcus sp. CA031C]RKI16995.1 DUF262 domain-containing protein [Corallococcus praedator]